MTAHLHGLLLRVRCCPKAAIFAVAGLSHAAALGPEIGVPFQRTTSVIASVRAPGLAVLTIVAFMDSIRQKLPRGSVAEKSG
ncbi:hypothetical protein HNP00_001074 [Arthrobacter sp. AZCC_0090]|nr:hypothetical protein [Arthrobacter sp. AZCC_0090]